MKLPIRQGSAAELRFPLCPSLAESRILLSKHPAIRTSSFRQGKGVGNKTLRRLSRVEFVPANFASLLIALAWAYEAGMSVAELVLPMFLAFAIISLVSIAGAHFNTYSDADLDKKDPTKGELVDALASFGRQRLKLLMTLEVIISAFFLFVLIMIMPNPALVILYLAAVFLAYSYSMPPLRLKARSILAMSSLMLILSIIPISFTYMVITPVPDLLFLVFLAGQCMIIYGLIIPTEIRDHDWDKGMGINTMTVWLGLKRATLLGIFLLTSGLVLMGTAFIMQSFSMGLALLGVVLVVPALTIAYVVKQFIKIHSLLHASNGRIGRDGIVAVAARNPRWITLVSQSIVIICFALLVAKII
jgi:4-hydroxybenzoate polyprenyltransferase